MVNSDHPYQQQLHQQNPYGHPYPNNTSHSQQNSNSLYYASNGNYAAVSTGRAATTPSNNGSDSALVSIDAAEAIVTSQVLTSNNLHAMGSQNVAYNHSHHNSNPQPRANLFRRFPLRSILKNGKVHNSSQATTVGEESGPSVPLSQPKSGILKKATTAEEAVITIGNGSIPSAAVQQQQQHNGGNPANSSSTSNHPPPQSQPLPILQVSPSSASSHASAKSAASLVQFAGSPSQPELPQQRKENSVSAHSFFLFVRILFSFA